ncbi:hypothetical protein Hypma_010981 [Hypsizygus marmoreus]|uniref:Uncharacterized protein n=1 Tax=Hypsizygus marmoreus TaxID=39966 RepID=A0A369JTK7_HYPMA|nr:hypothetical protein Hypma_010981 [Hypsizygus marmoreus]
MKSRHDIWIDVVVVHGQGARGLVLTRINEEKICCLSIYPVGEAGSLCIEEDTIQETALMTRSRGMRGLHFPIDVLVHSGLEWSWMIGKLIGRYFSHKVEGEEQAEVRGCGSEYHFLSGPVWLLLSPVTNVALPPYLKLKLPLLH